MPCVLNVLCPFVSVNWWIGFTDRDLDEVKGLFVDTNIYLLLLTMMVSVCHVSRFFAFACLTRNFNNWSNFAGYDKQLIEYLLCDEATGLPKLQYFQWRLML